MNFVNSPKMTFEQATAFKKKCAKLEDHKHVNIYRGKGFKPYLFVAPYEQEKWEVFATSCFNSLIKAYTDREIKDRIEIDPTKYGDDNYTVIVVVTTDDFVDFHYEPLLHYLTEQNLLEEYYTLK